MTFMYQPFLTTAIDEATRMFRPRYERELKHVNIDKEYMLIQNKSSKLSAGMRREVIRRYKEMTENRI